MSDELLQAYNLIRSGHPQDAKEVLEPALFYELDNKEILFTMSCCNFWIDVVRRSEDFDDPFERAECLVNEWKPFLAFVREKQVFERTMFAVKTGVFSAALGFYNQLGQEKNITQRAEILRKTGLCYKKLGSYDTARNCLTEASTLLPDSAPIIAEMADCYALCSEERQAKVLFREAFYMDAAKIETVFLDSELINCLIRNVAEKGYTGDVLMEWVPVYGLLYGVFTVKRKLRPQEIARLRREIYAKETEMKDPSCQKDTLVPHLINLYFWLIDYYVSANEDIRKINDILTRIKILDTEIYELYVK